MAERIPAAAWCLLGAVLLVPAGAVTASPTLGALAALCVLAAAVLQWGELLVMTRIFLVLALASGSVLLAIGEGGPLLRAAAQGAGFAALMAVLGLLRHPVRRSPLVAHATEALLATRRGNRFAATYAGSHLMALMFNVGIIAMIADLTDGRAGRQVLVIAAMRGAATVAIWSPLGLGFAIVSAGLPAFEPLPFLLVSVVFTFAALALTCRWPLLPAALDDGYAVPASRPGMSGVIGTALISAAILLGAIALHLTLEIGFTAASVLLLPLVALAWLARLGRLRETGAAVAGLTSLRNEGTIFLSASVIGIVLSVVLGRTAFPDLLASSALPMLPFLLGCMVLIPLAAAAYVPNSVFVVMVAQLLGPTPLGMEYPLALALALTVSWATAIAVSPISAMCLLAGAACGVPSRIVAHRWNAPYAAVLTGLGMVAVTVLALC